MLVTINYFEHLGLQCMGKTTNLNIHLCHFFLLSGVVRASSIFPILSAILLLLGGVCVASSRFYKTKRHIILGAGILFVVAGNISHYDSIIIAHVLKVHIIHLKLQLH